MAFSSASRSPFALTRLISRVTLKEHPISHHGSRMTTSTSTAVLFPGTPRFHPVPFSCSVPVRDLHTTHPVRGTAYEPDGKTTVTILNDEAGAPLMIDTYNQTGFKLNNGMRVMGPMAIFPKTVLSWDVGSVEDITPESLALFSVLEPKPDVLVIGVGDQGSQLNLETVKFLRKRGINMEILSTHHACTTFNFLSVEGRCTAAVILPPTHIVWTGADYANTKLKRKDLYESELGHSDELDGAPQPPPWIDEDKKKE